MSTWRRLLYNFLPYRKRIFAGILVTIAMGMSELLLAPAMGLIVNVLNDLGASISRGEGIASLVEIGSPQYYQFSYAISGYDSAMRFLGLFGALVAVLIFSKGIFLYAKELILESVSQKVLRQLRMDLFSHMMVLPVRYFDKGRTGAMMSRMTYDVSNVEQSFHSFISMAQWIIYTLLFLGYMLITQPALTLLSLILFPVAGVVIKVLGDRLRTVSRRITDHLAHANAYLNEVLSGVRITKSFGREPFEIGRFREKMDRHYHFSIKSIRLIALMRPSNEILSLGGMVLIIMYCGYRMINGAMTLGDLTEFLVLLTMVYKPVKGLGQVTGIVQRALASADSLFEMLDLEPEGAVLPDGPGTLDNVMGKIAFEDVKFGYKPDTPVLQGVDFTVEPGQTVALVGPSGVGKSTIFNLILRFYDPDSGGITIDGTDLRNVTRESLRAQMSVVPQEVVLFSGSVYDNILYGRLDASREDIIAAAQAAHVADFVQKLPEGYDTEIGERGAQLSGGQRQRIAIARALLANPRILLMDEATSSLDTESERFVQEATDRLMQNRTAFVIAHRLSTIQNANLILVMGKGRIIERGTHAELMAQRGAYRDLCEKQLELVGG